MSIDFAKPVKTDNYDTGLLSAIRAHFVALACMLDPTDAGSVSNPPTGARRWTTGGVLERFNGSAWAEVTTGYLKSATAATIYAPLTGTGASGTWGISVTGSAGSVAWVNVTGKPGIVGETANTGAVASTLAKRDSSGNVFATAFNQASGLETPAVGAVFVQNAAGDGQLRKISLANFNAAIAPVWGNVTSKPTTLAGFGITDALSAAAAAAGYAALSSGPTFTGLVKARGGGLGLGQIIVQNGGTPPSMSAGDLCFIY